MSNTVFVCYLLYVDQDMNLWWQYWCYYYVMVIMCFLEHVWSMCYLNRYDELFYLWEQLYVRYVIWITNMIRYEWQAWYDMKCKHDMIWYASSTRYDDAWCIGPKRGCQLTILGIALIMKLTDGLMKWVSIRKLWTYEDVDRRSYETGHCSWTDAKEPT